MRAVVQRVHAASVRVAGELIGSIGTGLVAFVGVGREDTIDHATKLADKIVGLRVFDDDAGRMAHALLDRGYGLLVVSQFTLYADTSRGRRPGFELAMAPAPAEALYELFVAEARARVPTVQTGRFGADMRVHAENDGPVTLVLEV